MTPKERAAMQQALEALEDCECSWKQFEAIAACEEALEHSGEANEMVVGWDRVKPEAIASDPLYQQGFVDGVEEGRNQVAEQAEQSQLADATLEPVAWMSPNKERLEFSRKDTVYGSHTIPLYAAPVRTKDLTDAEIADALYGKGCWRLGVHPDHLREYRRVIQADRELNK